MDDPSAPAAPSVPSSASSPTATVASPTSVSPGKLNHPNANSSGYVSANANTNDSALANANANASANVSANASASVQPSQTAADASASASAAMNRRPRLRLLHEPQPSAIDTGSSNIGSNVRSTALPLSRGSSMSSSTGSSIGGGGFSSSSLSSSSSNSGGGGGGSSGGGGVAGEGRWSLMESWKLLDSERPVVPGTPRTTRCAVVGSAAAATAPHPQPAATAADGHGITGGKKKHNSFCSGSSGSSEHLSHDMGKDKDRVAGGGGGKGARTEDGNEGGTGVGLEPGGGAEGKSRHRRSRSLKMEVASEDLLWQGLQAQCAQMDRSKLRIERIDLTCLGDSDHVSYEFCITPASAPSGATSPTFTAGAASAHSNVVAVAAAGLDADWLLDEAAGGPCTSRRFSESSYPLPPVQAGGLSGAVVPAQLQSASAATVSEFQAVGAAAASPASAAAGTWAKTVPVLLPRPSFSPTSHRAVSPGMPPFAATAAGAAPAPTVGGVGGGSGSFAGLPPISPGGRAPLLNKSPATSGRVSPADLWERHVQARAMPQLQLQPRPLLHNHSAGVAAAGAAAAGRLAHPLPHCMSDASSSAGLLAGGGSGGGGLAAAWRHHLQQRPLPLQQHEQHTPQQQALRRVASVDLKEWEQLQHQVTGGLLGKCHPLEDTSSSGGFESHVTSPSERWGSISSNSSSSSNRSSSSGAASGKGFLSLGGTGSGRLKRSQSSSMQGSILLGTSAGAETTAATSPATAVGQAHMAIPMWSSVEPSIISPSPSEGPPMSMLDFVSPRVANRARHGFRANGNHHQAASNWEVGKVDQADGHVRVFHDGVSVLSDVDFPSEDAATAWRPVTSHSGGGLSKMKKILSVGPHLGGGGKEGHL